MTERDWRAVFAACTRFVTGHYPQPPRRTLEALAALDGVELTPNPPHTNMFHLFLRGELVGLNAAALNIAAETGVWLLRGPALRPSQIPVYQMMEFVAGQAALDVPTAEIAALYAELLCRARA